MFSDILNRLTMRTEASKKLVDEVEEFAALKKEIDSARCVLEMDTDGNLLHVNRNMLDALGYQGDELVSQHHRTLLNRADASGTEYQDFWDALKLGQTQTGQFKLTTRNDEGKWFQGYYAAVMRGSELRKVVAYLTDITDEKSNSLDMQAEGDGVNQVFAVAELAMDTTITAMNDVFLNALGYRREEVVGHSLGMLLAKEDKTNPEYIAKWEGLKRGETQVKQVRRFTKEGKELWFQASFFPVKDQEGNVIRVMNYCSCVTKEKLKNADYEGQLSAISKIQGVIEFDLKGNILSVNDNFVAVTGYAKEDIVGNHHSMFVEADYKASNEYKAFWDKLGRGEPDEGVYKRIGKGGKEIWLQASYNPIYGLDGKAFKVVKYATDITVYKLQEADNAGQIEALNKVLGVIEFDLKGNITKVNENFAKVTGYSQDEIVGSHHSMFVEADYKVSAEYKEFWKNLGAGEADSGKYKRIGKDGKEIWLEASYNPILDLNEKPFKVVKFATDITEQYNNASALEAAVEETQHVIELAKTGDLSNRVPLAGKTGAIASLCDGVNALMDKMTEVLLTIREAGETINTAAGEISTGNTDLSGRTEQQASSLEETASSMEQLSSTVKQNAENAKQANQLAAAASGVAIKGGEVVGEVVTTMSAINESAKKIEDIITVIDGIAFQTNILALNAAVEAARAGEQGRGFAVVAGEVRNLAQRSASAAKEIKELIADSVTKTSEGTKLVENAGETMQEIVSSVQRVTDIMGEITAASNEQSAGIDQVNQAVTNMDETTQQNAALVEEAAAAAESLVDQSVSLMDTVNEFNLQGHSEKPKQERRSASSSMRGGSRSAARPSLIKASAKTGTNNQEWEAF